MEQTSETTMKGKVQKHGQLFLELRQYSPMLKRRGSRVVQNVLPSMIPICALTGWSRSRCFLGGIMSCRTSLCGSITSVTLLFWMCASTCRQCIAYTITITVSIRDHVLQNFFVWLHHLLSRPYPMATCPEFYIGCRLGRELFTLPSYYDIYRHESGRHHKNL